MANGKLPPNAYVIAEGETYVPYTQGKSLAEFTVKAVLSGVLLGVVFGAANTYLGLKAGLTISTSIPVAVLSVVAFRLLKAFGLRHTILELNTSQTVGRRITNQWATVSYGGSFSTVPVVLSQVQTENDASWVKTRQRNVAASSFQVALEKEEASLLTHPTESVGWLAISPASGTWSGHPFVASRTGNAVTGAWFAISFSQNVGSVPQFLAAMSTYDGGDNSELRYRNLGGGSVEVRVEEETTFDTEVAHTTEVVDYLVIGKAGTLEGSAN